MHVLNDVESRKFNHRLRDYEGNMLKTGYIVLTFSFQKSWGFFSFISVYLHLFVLHTAAIFYFLYSNLLYIHFLLCFELHALKTVHLKEIFPGYTIIEYSNQSICMFA